MGDCLHLPLSSAIIMIIILSRGLIQLARYRANLRPRYSPVKASTEHCCLLKGLCQNSPLPTPLVLTPGPDHPPTVRAVPGLSSCTDLDVKPPTFLDNRLAWSRAVPDARHIYLYIYVWTWRSAMSTFLSLRNDVHTHSKNRNNIKRDIGRHILNGLNFKIKQRETSKATHPTIFWRKELK